MQDKFKTGDQVWAVWLCAIHGYHAAPMLYDRPDPDSDQHYLISLASRLIQLAWAFRDRADALNFVWAKVHSRYRESL